MVMCGLGVNSLGMYATASVNRLSRARSCPQARCSNSGGEGVNHAILSRRRTLVK